MNIDRFQLYLNSVLSVKNLSSEICQYANNMKLTYIYINIIYEDEFVTHIY